MNNAARERTPQSPRVEKSRLSSLSTPLLRLNKRTIANHARERSIDGMVNAASHLFISQPPRPEILREKLPVPGQRFHQSNSFPKSFPQPSRTHLIGHPHPVRGAVFPEKRIECRKILQQHSRKLGKLFRTKHTPHSLRAAAQDERYTSQILSCSELASNRRHVKKFGLNMR